MLALAPQSIDAHSKWSWLTQLQAFRAAREATAAEIAAANGVKSSAAATEREVARVLCARDDYEVLRLAPGAAMSALKKRYREMAVALHPDKCRVRRGALSTSRRSPC